MVIFKNTFSKLLSEEEDNGTLEGNAEESVSNEEQNNDLNDDDNLDSQENEEEQDNNEGEEDTSAGEEMDDNDNNGGEEDFEGDSDESSIDKENNNEEEEASSEDSNPIARKVYFDRFTSVRDQYKSFENIVHEGETNYFLDEIYEAERNTIIYIHDKIDESLKQIEHLIVYGKILKLEISTLKKLYNKIQSKLVNLIELYEEVINKNL